MMVRSGFRAKPRFSLRIPAAGADYAPRRNGRYGNQADSEGIIQTERENVRDGRKQENRNIDGRRRRAGLESRDQIHGISRERNRMGGDRHPARMGRPDKSESGGRKRSELYPPADARKHAHD